ncbi:sugar ABC transporter substrate-binding protein [Candidatus Dojkabacteria bacterium]|nr:sugar ABC transporter substrate-binding protein [Candidatus Dojkabacteria bacterium]
MQKKTIICIIMLLLGVFVSVTSIQGCSKKKDVKKVAFVVTTLSNPFFIDMTDAAKAEIKNHPGYEIIIQAPERGATDVERQIQIVENLITQKVDALCVVPADSRSIIETIIKANKAGIPFLNIDNKVDFELAKERKAVVAAYIGSDNYLGGKLASEYIVVALNGKGKVAILEGVSGVEAAIKRKAGFVDYLKEYPDIKIVASQPADWDREKGLNIFQNILQANPDVKALFACNDEMALGAVEAIKAAGKEEQIIVVGFDATKDGLAAVENGSMAATVAQLPSEMGKMGILKAISILEGINIEKEIPTEVKLIEK